ncbi:hypothetical protein ACFPM0_07095 [Pseudonocardia sulfidoxydans]|uniref:hypothetical protein n=1 Tax=Pseudonocardia sulfidoxydans TaxID=54011 RepID=UPI0036199F55
MAGSSTLTPTTRISLIRRLLTVVRRHSARCRTGPGGTGSVVRRTARRLTMMTLHGPPRPRAPPDGPSAHTCRSGRAVTVIPCSSPPRPPPPSGCTGTPATAGRVARGPAVTCDGGGGRSGYRPVGCVMDRGQPRPASCEPVRKINRNLPIWTSSPLASTAVSTGSRLT